MSRRLVHTEKLGKCSAKIFKDTEWSEYVVQWTPGPKRLARGSDGLYHAGGAGPEEKLDAIGTAKFELSRMQARGLCGVGTLGRARPS